MTHSTQVAASIEARVAAAVAVAATHARMVDETSSVPIAAIESMKRERLLGPGPEPRYDGGPRFWTAAQLFTVAARLGSACSSTGLLWATHQGQLQSIARHCGGSQFFTEYLTSAWTTQPLIAGVVSDSATAEMLPGFGRVRIGKHASTASYLRAADAVLIAVGQGADQVVVLAEPPDLRVAETAGWHALGMRGAARDEIELEAEVPSDRVLPEPYPAVAAATTHPFTYLGWAGCWWGIASSAVETARRYLRAERVEPDLATAKATRLGELSRTLSTLRGQGLAFAADVDAGTLTDAERASAGNFLRLSAAELALQAALGAFELIGVEAYRTGPDAPYALGRQLRDLLSALVMISGDRIRLTNGTLAV